MFLEVLILIKMAWQPKKHLIQNIFISVWSDSVIYDF